MDWLKLFALLVAVASVQISADGPKKKIRIHLPQKVKHIHHHKKIYITNHAAPSQYAPAYMPGRDGAVALPTNVALPAVTNILPLNSMEVIDENHHRLHGISPGASKLLPLYRARGYYGPNRYNDIEDDYDLNPPPDTVDSYLPAAYSSSATATKNHLPKKVKIVKINDQPSKKVVRKGRHKRVVVRKRPLPPPPVDEEIPVTNFHEQFYADLDGSGIIRKIRTPPRVEKIVDGDTEHIHAYSEEHIHKLVFEDPNKYSSVVGVDPMTSMSAMSPTRPIIPYKKAQTIIALPSDSYSNLPGLGPLEYATINRDVTHDHIFHDHGEIPANVDITKDGLSLPPKVSYNSKGLRISGGSSKRPKPKYNQRLKKINKPQPSDFSYYESIYTPNRPKKTHRQTLPFLDETDSNLNDYRTINNVGYKDTSALKPRNFVPNYYGKSGQEYRTQHDNTAAPFSVSSTVVHDYKPKAYASASSPMPRYKDRFVNFKDNYANNYEYDTYASSSNILYATDDKNENSVYSFPDKKSSKKSISTQNISFGGKEHLTYVDHLQDSSLIDDETPTALDFDQLDQPQFINSPNPTPFTIEQSSPAHPYYTVVAVKAMHDEPSMPAASNDNFQYAEAPTPSSTPVTPSLATSTSPLPQSSPEYNVQSTSSPAIESIQYLIETKPSKKYKESNTNLNEGNVETSPRDTYVHKEVETPVDHRVKSLQTPDQVQLVHQNPITGRAKLKYGDKI